MKKILCLAALLSFSFAGCGGTTTPAKDAATTPASTAGEGAKEGDAAKDPAPAGDAAATTPAETPK